VTVVGLGGTAVLEARDRLRAAFGNTGYEWPDRRITVSLPPADLPQAGLRIRPSECQLGPC
jgi:magnesium chelatase family protein